MIKVFGICICVLICTLIVKQYNRPMAVTISLAGVCVSILVMLDKVSGIIKSVKNMVLEISSSQEYITIMLKVLCIVLVTQIVSNLCRDNNENTLSTVTEISAKVVIIVIIMPMFEVIVSILNGLVKWKDF